MQQSNHAVNAPTPVANIQLRPKDGAKVLGIGLSTFWNRAKTDPDFPKLRRFGARCTTVSLADLNAYIDSKAGGAK